MIKPDSTITESYGVLVGRTLVNMSNWSAKVLVINPGSDIVVLPPSSCVGSVMQVSAVTIARAMSIQPETTPHGSVLGSHPSLGAEGHVALTDLLY